MVTNFVLLATPFVMFAAIGLAVSRGHSRRPSVAAEYLIVDGGMLAGTGAKSYKLTDGVSSAPSLPSNAEITSHTRQNVWRSR
jgi:hypothetical protein